MHIDPAAVLAVISGQAQQIAELSSENTRLREALNAAQQEGDTQEGSD